MRESELESEAHRSHALEWRSDDTCMLCLIEIIRADSSSRLKIHRRFALATLNHRLNPDVTLPSFQQENSSCSSKNLARLLQKNHNVSSQVLNTLLDSLTSVDVVDLAIEAVYRLYHHVLRDETVLDNVLTHCVQKSCVQCSSDYDATCLVCGGKARPITRHQPEAFYTTYL